MGVPMTHGYLLASPNPTLSLPVSPLGVLRPWPAGPMVPSPLHPPIPSEAGVTPASLIVTGAKGQRAHNVTWDEALKPSAGWDEGGAYQELSGRRHKRPQDK